MRLIKHNRATSLIVVGLLLTTVLSAVALVTAEAATEGSFTYTVSGGKATITGYTGTGGAISIPATCGGNPTGAIGSNAFKNAAITSVTVPDSVTTIGNTAFDRCSLLTSVDLGNGVTSIGTSAFYMCNALTSVVIPNSVTIIGTTAFNHCVLLSSVTIGNQVTTIGNYAFADCYSLMTVTIPASVISVGGYTFSGCPSMTAINVDPANLYYSSNDGVLYNKANTTIIQFPCGKSGTFTIPSTVTEVGWAFAYCVGLSEINVDTANPSYSSHDGVLFTKDNNTLVQYPLAKTGNYVIPEKTTTIASYAFFHCNVLTAITLPVNLTYVSDYAFRNCTHLSNVIMLGNLTHLGFYSFANCSALASVSFYQMTAPTWVANLWTVGGSAGLVGHAYAASNFPAPGTSFWGLTMGSYLSANPAVPGAPTGLTATTMSGSIMLNWTAPSDQGSGVANYLIFRGTSAGGEGATPIATVPGLSYSDSTGTAGTPYYYVVKANNSVGVSIASAEVHSSANAATVPSAPQNLRVTTADNKVTLQWTAPSSDGGSSILSYDIYRSDSGGAWTKITSVTATTFSYVDNSGGDGTGHQYYVAAVNSVGKGTTTDPKSVGSSSDNGGSSDNTAIFAGLGILAVIIVLALLFVIMKRRK